ncbi:carbohydrate-binding protein [Citrobacter youngae]|uniref:gp53-like domain-containing protein n=2 Tax=Enterobacteriaceae TaxID=543 RepID=UPI001F1BD754|nr:carbohydrate-binding protein [Citrobacter youngae]
MSKIARYQGNVRAFASDAQGMERTVFGGTNQADDLTSQITASFLRGWGIVGASEHPSLEDFNAAMYAMSQFIAYQHQMGVPEWHAEQEYHIGSICTHNGESYQSLQNANIGSQPPSAKWTPVLTSKNGLANLGFGSFPQYQTLGDGQHIFQHGTGGSNSSGIADIVFPKAFTTTNNLNVTATATSQQPANYIVTVGSVTTTGVRLYLTGANAGSTPVAAAIGFHWKAEGR